MTMKYFMLLFWLSLCAALNAQKTEGTILFEEKMNMHRNLPPDAQRKRWPNCSSPSSATS